MELEDNSSVIHVAGGLGNIMQMMVRGHFACKRAGIKNCYYWWRTKNPLVTCGLDELFDLAVIENLSGLKIHCLNNTGGWDFLHKPEIAPAILPFIDQYWCSSVSFRSDRVPKYFLTPMLFKMSECRHMPWTDFYHSIVPVQSLQTVIKKWKDALITPPALGVHIRRTDNNKSYRSTDDKFMKAVDENIDLYRTVLLATDEARIEDLFTKRYGSRIVFMPKSSPVRWSSMRRRKTFVTIDFYKEAIVDMWLLSNCDLILGSIRSSFSKAAFRVSQNPSIKFKLVI